MHELYTYHIEIRDQVDETAFNAASPFQMTVLRTDPAATLFAVRTDQSGLIGLLRHLHRQGFVLYSVHRER
jgi:hypothetical protein